MKNEEEDVDQDEMSSDVMGPDPTSAYDNDSSEN